MMNSTRNQQRMDSIARTLASAWLGLGTASLLTLTSAPALAALTVSSVERASVVEGVGTASSVTIYGGVSGDISRCSSVTVDSTCSTCTLTAAQATDLANGTPSGTPDADYLLACNERRIHPDLDLLITVSSDAVDGRITITNANGDTAVASTATNVIKGTTGQIAVKWSTICTKVFEIDGGGGTNCEPTSGHASGSLKVGISSDGDDLLNGSSDDSRTLNFIIRGATGSSVATDCDDAATDPRICYFELGPGDEKAIVQALRKPDGNSFPSGENTTFKYVRFLFDERGFEYINLGSSFFDLPISGSSPFDVSPKRIEGLGNDRQYFFKAAVIDAAGNVGMYSSAATNTDCQHSPEPGDTTCRVITPSAVVGVLDKTNCFIATAAYGSSLAPELGRLRNFRDQVLLTNFVGKSFVKFYYFVSPPLAKWVHNNETARAITRKALIPFVWFAGLGLTAGANSFWWFFGALAMVSTIAVYMATSRQKRRRPHANRDRSHFPTIIFILGLGAASFAFDSAAQAQDALGDSVESEIDSPAQVDASTPIQALEDEEAPPPAEYPYPGATGDWSKSQTQAEATAPVKTRKKKRAQSKATKFSDTPTPLKSNGWVPRPNAISEDGDYVYEAQPEIAPKQHGPPKTHKFSNTPGREAPDTITTDGEFLYPVAQSEFSGAGGLRFGLMAPPDIVNGSNGLSFKDIYGADEVPALLFEYEYPLTDFIGRIGIKFESGFYSKSARGRFKNPALTELPEERFTFLMVPLQATVIYRFQFVDDQLFVPFVEGGGAYYGIVELRDDSKGPLFGGSPALVAAGGVNILLDWLDRSSVRQLDAEYGINHVWLSLQYRQVIGVKKDLDISSRLMTAGITFDF